MDTAKNFLYVGITGGVGAGKSLAGKLLQEKGYKIIDSDQISRRITEPNSPILEKITATFGKQSIKDDGTLNRAFLRSLIMNDAEARKKLEQITHPEIQKQSLHEAKAYASKHTFSLIFYEAPLLFEANAQADKDYIICVIADEKIRIERIINRDKCSSEEAKKIISNQWPQEKKAELSDFIISNNKTIQEFENQLQAILDRLLIFKNIYISTSSSSD
ncbi:MAG: dephospho-CoA kinase [Oligoflexia bacterium]|nr:dephospho-CoA kinase [Oligoflexia bacterium]